MAYFEFDKTKYKQKKLTGLSTQTLSRNRLMTTIRITHKPTDTLIAEGPKGWGITSFEGNYYISAKHLKTDKFRKAYIPGVCPYKFIYVWEHFIDQKWGIDRMLGWRYVVPNPIFPFIAFRLAVPGNHPSLRIDVFDSD
ncbi:hypothetical protein ACFL2V_15965 [Pseudomonadota bacterium]